MSGSVLNHVENMNGRLFPIFKAYSTSLSDFDSLSQSSTKYFEKGLAS